MAVSVAEALTRSGGLIADRGSEGCAGILLVKFPLIFFGARSKLMGARDTGTPLTSFGATLHHYNANRTASRGCTTPRLFSSQSIASPAAWKQGPGKLAAASKFYPTRVTDIDGARRSWRTGGETRKGSFSAKKSALKRTPGVRARQLHKLKISRDQIFCRNAKTYLLPRLSSGRYLFRRTVEFIAIPSDVPNRM